MLVKLQTFSLLGIDALAVEVEVDVAAQGLPKTTLVGLPEAAVRESLHRVERAIINSGFSSPRLKTVINLAPADIPKQAAAFDLPISLGLLAASGQLNSDMFRNYAIIGELALDGSTRSCKGALSIAMAARATKLRGLILPAENAREATVVEGLEIIPVSSLAEAIGFLSGELKIEPQPSALATEWEKLSHYDFDFADVCGQELAKRALTVAAAGGHNLLMIGPPGTGKTMLAKRFLSILPPLSRDESLETTRVFSVLGYLDAGVPLLATRPFREPHHTISEAGLVGGGSPPAPGEISLAHNGVLFLDELPEFQRRTLEVLRQPLEDGRVTIARASHTSTFPARFILIGALNPCPCGYRGDPRRKCRCLPTQVERYMTRISGPLLDRLDIHIEVPPVDYHELSGKRQGTNSESMHAQVMAAREVQNARFRRGKIRVNSQMSHRQIVSLCQIDSAGHAILKNAMESFGLSARAHDKILRISRTIADLEGQENISADHLYEAVNYRTLDRKLWRQDF